MTPVEKLLDKLHRKKKSGNGWAALCPAHPDAHPSLSISEGENGKVLVKFHAGCSVESIVNAVGLEMKDLFPVESDEKPTRSKKPTSGATTFASCDDAVNQLEDWYGQSSASWTYHDADGEPVGLVLRWDQPDGTKEIRPVAMCASGWRIGAMPEPRPLYRLPELRTAERVLVCEGEKAADAARSLGCTATTSAGGSQAAGKTDWHPLAGKEVWILPDNDEPGRQYADNVATILANLRPSSVIKVVELRNLPVGGDIVEWIDGKEADSAAMRAELEAMANGIEFWRLVDPDDLSFHPFPVDALPEPIRGFVAAGAKAIGCDPSYVAMPLLTMLAAAIGNTRRLELKRGWRVSPIIWSAIVGESGTAKTPAFKLAMKPFRERQRDALDRHKEHLKQYEAELAVWDKDMTIWKRDKKATGPAPEKPDPPQATRIIVSDTTVEALAPILLASPRGLLMARDELAGWLGSFDRYAGNGKANADESQWLSMFNAESIVVDRKTGNPRTIYVPRAAVCVTGGIQPAILKRALGQEHRESGLAARLLLAYPPQIAKHWTEADIRPEAEAELARLVDRLFDLNCGIDDNGNPSPELVRFTSEAKEVWIEYYNAHAAEQAAMTGDMAAAWSKLEEYAARLALVIHFIRWAANDSTLPMDGRVDAESIKAGIRLTQWFKHEARRVYAMLNEAAAERDQRRLVEWIARQGRSLTAREVRQGCRWLKSSGMAEAALEKLVEAGRGIWEPSPPGKPGQPTRRLKLNASPAVYANTKLPTEILDTVDVDTVRTPATGTARSPASASQFGDRAFSGPYRDRI